MNKVLLITALLLFNTGLGAEKLVKVGSETDFAASALLSPNFKSFQSVSRNNTTLRSFTLIGAQTGLSKDRKALVLSLATEIKQLLQENEWQVDSPWSNNGGDQWFSQILIVARRAKESIDITLTVFPDKDGRTHVAYTQRRGY